MIFSMAINLWGLGSDLSWKDGASSKKEITRSLINYLCNIWEKNKEEKGNICLIYYYIFTSFHLTFLCLIVLLFCLYFCLLSRFKITRFIGDSLVINSTWKQIINSTDKRKLASVILGARIWVPRLVYHSPKQPGYGSDLELEKLY